MIVNAETQHEIEQFFYEEAALLDQHKYGEWFELFAEDCHYWMPIRQTRPATQDDEEFTRPGEIAFFDESHEALKLRVSKIKSPFAWGESPRPRTRRMYSNIRVLSVDEGEMTVSCNFIFYRSALQGEVDWFVGRREDVIRRTEGQFKIVKRWIYLDQTVIYAKNMNQFF